MGGAFKVLRALKIVALGVFVVIGAYGLWGLLGLDDHTLNKVQSPKADLEVQSASYTAFAGETQWGFEAKEMHHFAERGIMTARDLRLWANFKDGRRLEAEAKQGKALYKGEVVELEGNVKLRFQDLELEAEALTYEVGKSLLGSSSPVKVKKRDLLLQGQGLSFDLSGKRLALGGGVRAVLGGQR